MSKKTDHPRTEADWRDRLDPMQYQVLREGATEHPFTGAYWNTKTPGVYACAGCGMELFDSNTKFDSGTGWPSFWEAMDPERIETRVDTSHGMVRTEVLCKSCGGHLGHVFPDGPRPTGMRYCLNSCSLDLKPSD
jgi:peptide-methionine (R)-S-oxide reductase